MYGYVWVRDYIRYPVGMRMRQKFDTHLGMVMEFFYGYGYEIMKPVPTHPVTIPSWSKEEH